MLKKIHMDILRRLGFTKGDFSGFVNVSGFINFRVFEFVGVYTERIFGFLTHDDNSANIPDEMANKLLPRQRERKCRQKNVGGV